MSSPITYTRSPHSVAAWPRTHVASIKSIKNGLSSGGQSQRPPAQASAGVAFGAVGSYARFHAAKSYTCSPAGAGSAALLALPHELSGGGGGDSGGGGGGAGARPTTTLSRSPYGSSARRSPGVCRCAAAGSLPPAAAMRIARTSSFDWRTPVAALVETTGVRPPSLRP